MCFIWRRYLEGGGKEEEKKKGARRLARFNVWLAHGCFATSCTEFSRQAEVVSALYTNCVIYIPQLRGSRAPRPLFLAKIFSITPPTYPRKRRKIILKKKRKNRISTVRVAYLNNPATQSPKRKSRRRNRGWWTLFFFSFFFGRTFFHETIRGIIYILSNLSGMTGIFFKGVPVSCNTNQPPLPSLPVLCTYFPSFSELLKLLYKILNRIGSSKLVRIFNVF